MSSNLLLLPPLNMDIQMWYNKEVSQWRWTLTDPLDESSMESGSSSELEVALEDVGRAIGWLVDKGSRKVEVPAVR
jgi:hypothetical protein